MNPHDAEKLEKIERDRKRREDELLLALLLLIGETRRDIVVALKHDLGYERIITRATDRAQQAFAITMAESYRDGFRRLALLTDDPTVNGPKRVDWLDEYVGALAGIVLAFREPAQEAAVAIGDKLREAVVNRPLVNPETGAALKLGPSMRLSLSNVGMTMDSPRLLDVGAERSVVGAHNAGMFNGAQRLENKITGLRHVSVRDDRTTDICIERDGLMYPLDDPYWVDGGIPPLHWGCRSTILAIYGDFIRSERYPVTQPQPGFGYASAVFFSRLNEAA